MELTHDLQDGDGVVDAKEFAQGMAEGKLGGPGYGMGMPGTSDVLMRCDP